jgi:hypothetical protein
MQGIMPTADQAANPGKQGGPFMAAETIVVPKATLSEQLRARIVEVADKASDDDRKALAELIAEATQGKYSAKIASLHGGDVGAAFHQPQRP